MTISVNGEPVPESLVAEEYERLRPLPFFQNIPTEEERMSQLKKMAELSAIDRVLLRQQIQADTEPLDPKLVARDVEGLLGSAGCRGIMREKLQASVEAEHRRRRVVERLAGPMRKPSPEQMRAFYDANPGEFKRAVPEYHAAHIVIRTTDPEGDREALALMREAQAELDSGAPFGSVAERYSDCKENGGDLGFFAEGVMVEEFEREISRLEPGRRTGIFRSPFGFHIAELRAKLPAGPKPFEEVAPQLESSLSSFLADQALRIAMARLRAGSVVERLP